MTPQILSNFIASVIENIIYLSSAEILLSQKFKNILPLFVRIILFAIVESIYNAITYQYFNSLNLNHIRIIINILINLLLLKIIFKKFWWEIIKIFIFMEFFGFFSKTIILFIIVYFYKLSPYQILSDHLSILFNVVLPLEVLSLIFPLLLHKFREPIIDFLANIKTFKGSSLINLVTGAIIFQFFLLISLMADYVGNVTYKENPLRFLSIIIIIVSVMALSIFILYKTILKTEQKVVEASRNIMSENLTSLFNSARSQRHDFINHVQIIKSLFYAHDEQGLAAYLSHLTNDISVLNTVLAIDNPFIGALLNSKITTAGVKGIELQIEINTKIPYSSVKTFDLTRVLDNLINNAIEDIELNNKVEKWIKVIIGEQGPFLTISVINPGSPSSEIIEKIFEPGYTTKGSEHSGLGLYICKQLSKKLHGKLDFKSISGIETRFSLIIPKF